MSFLNFLKDKALYLLIYLLVFGTGFYLTHKGVYVEASNRSNSAILISIGTSLIASSIVMFLELIRHLSISQVLSRLNNIVNEGGLQWIYSKRDLDKYDHMIKDLNTSLDIAGYSLGAFFDSYSSLLKTKLMNREIRIRVLIVDPSSIHSVKRAEIEGRNPEQFRDKIQTFVQFFKNIPGVELRYFNAPLSSMIFRIDKVMFIGPHFYKMQSKATLTQELKSGQWLFNEFQEEFNRMWSDSTSVIKN